MSAPVSLLSILISQSFWNALLEREVVRVVDNTNGTRSHKTTRSYKLLENTVIARSVFAVTTACMETHKHHRGADLRRIKQVLSIA